ncbi:MAG: helix-turn-helix domain-containing protein [Sphaerochaetaceae bacterium]
MSVGQNIMRARKDRNLTIKDVSIMSDITPSLISQIENDKANPSLNTLNSLARAIGVEVSFFFTGVCDNSNSPVVRSTERPLISKAKGFTNYQLSPGGIEKFSVYYNILEPGGTTAHSPEHHPISATGYEFGYLISGKLQITINDNVYILTPGDSICIDATQKHITTNISSEDSEMLWMMVP